MGRGAFVDPGEGDDLGDPDSLGDFNTLLESAGSDDPQAISTGPAATFTAHRVLSCAVLVPGAP